VIWGTDAATAQQRVGATVFPTTSARRDPRHELIRRIGEITAIEMR